MRELREENEKLKKMFQDMAGSCSGSWQELGSGTWP